MPKQIAAAPKRAIVYIDGLNFYYGALRPEEENHPERKWLHLERWAEAILPMGWRLDGVRYFTSQVIDGDRSGAPERQAVYLAALRALGFRDVFEHSLVAPDLRAATNNPPKSSVPPSNLARAGGLTIHYGHRSRKQVVYGWPRGESKKRQFRISPKEKGTDVNLTARMTADAAHDRFDAAVLVANDSDYAGLCRIVREEFTDADKFGGRKEIVLYPPALGRRRLVEQLAASVGEWNVRQIFPALLDACQLPEVIPGTKIRRPMEWRKKS